MALVDVGVHVDEGRPGHAAVEIEPRRVNLASRRRDALDMAVGDDDVGGAKAIGVGFAGRIVEEDAGDRSVGDDVARPVGDGDETGIGHLNSPGARRSRAICGGGGMR